MNNIKRDAETAGKGRWEILSFTRMKTTTSYSVSKPTISGHVVSAVAGTIPVIREDSSESRR